MKHTLNFFISVLLVSTLCICTVSCNNNSTTNKTADTDTTKPRWIDPQRGKYYGKVNEVQIPLTAIEDHILGLVRSVRYIDYKISEKDGSKVLDDSGYNVYDKFGHLIDQNEYKADGSPKWKCVYKYDNNNKALEWNFNFSYVDTYSEKVTFKYDDKGHQLEQITVSSNPKYSNRTEYKYDDKGNQIEDATYYPDNGGGSITNYKYDNRGFQIEMTMKLNNGQLIRKSGVIYDNAGNKTGGIDYDPRDTIHGAKWTEVNDSKGRPLQTIFYDKDGKIAGMTKMKHDDWDNEIESITYKADSSIDTTRWNTFSEYEYDSKGNTTKQTLYKLKAGKKIPTNLTETVYQYY